MTTMTAPSAYPRSVEDLIPHAQDLAAELGEVPSRNKLMKTFRIGGDKAKLLIAELTAAPAAPLPAKPAEPSDDVPKAAPLPERVPAEPLAEPVEIVAVTEPPVPAESDAEMPPPLASADPDAPAEAEPVAAKRRRPVTWPVLILCLPAFVAIWGGWVEMGRLTGFGKVTLLPGFSAFQIDTAITLPIGVETYAAYALYVWLSGWALGTARTFAKWSALASLLLGGLGQVAYHLMSAAGWDAAPWPITAAVACIPVAVLGMGAGLAHLMHR
jgi:hypothetical protein